MASPFTLLKTSDDLGTAVAELRQEVAELRREVAALRSANTADDARRGTQTRRTPTSDDEDHDVCFGCGQHSSCACQTVFDPIQSSWDARGMTVPDYATIRGNIDQQLQHSNRLGIDDHKSIAIQLNMLQELLEVSVKHPARFNRTAEELVEQRAWLDDAKARLRSACSASCPRT
jgi:hypothetical protein